MKKYCSECRLPLASSAAVTCDKCGKPTRPTNIFERIAGDEYLSPKDKKLLGFIGALDIAACVISMLWTLLVIVVITEVSARLADRLSMGLIEPEYVERFRFMLVFYRNFVIFSVITVVEQLVTLLFSVMILLKKEWAVQVCRGLYLVNAVLYFLFGNLISFAMGLYLTIRLSGFISKLERGSEYDRRAENVMRSAYIASDKTVWDCRSCGYVNPVSASECKSCGKWMD